MSSDQQSHNSHLASSLHKPANMNLFLFARGDDIPGFKGVDLAYAGHYEPGSLFTFHPLIASGGHSHGGIGGHD